jgi:hypothetical protein
MRRVDIQIDREDVQAALLPRLRGRVFHVSCYSNLHAIQTAGEIASNGEGKLQSSFGSAERSYYRLRGCVSVFDYRRVEESDLQLSLGACSPFQALWNCRDALAFFFLTEEALARLDVSGQSREALRSGHMVVPYVEAGYPESIPLSCVEEVLVVRVTRQVPKGSYLEALLTPIQRDP